MLAAKAIEFERPPQRPAQPHVAEAARPFQPDLFQPDRDRLARLRLEQLVLLVPPDVNRVRRLLRNRFLRMSPKYFILDFARLRCAPTRVAGSYFPLP